MSLSPPFRSSLVGHAGALRRLLAMIWPFLATVACLVWLASESMNTLSAVRAYVSGESLWTKGQRDAIASLSRYLQTHEERDYRAFQEHISVPLGDRKARIALDRSNPDIQAAWEGYTQGRNHPDDIAHAIKLFVRFRQVSFMERVVKIWAQGDEVIEDIIHIGSDIHQEASGPHPDAAQLQRLGDQLRLVNSRITPLEVAFSTALGEASRKTEALMLLVMVLTATLLTAAGTLLSRRVQRRAELVAADLALSEERFELAVAGSNDGIWDWNIDTGEVYFSPRAMELLGFDGQEIDGTVRAVRLLMHPDDVVAADRTMVAHLKEGERYDVEYRMRYRTGEYRWYRARGESIRNAHGRSVRMSGSVTDITDRKLAEQQLFQEKERAQVTLSSIGDGVIATDIRGVIEYMNPVAESQTGWTASDAIGMPLGRVFHVVAEAVRSVAVDPLHSILSTGTIDRANVELILVKRDGSESAITQSAAPIRNRASEMVGVVLVFRDVTRERQISAKLTYQATHDMLTGLLNRREFENRLTLALSEVERNGRRFALIYLDLDQFKLVNDTSGHAAGDELIRAIANILMGQIRSSDCVGRIGGDEFAALIYDCSLDDAAHIAEGCRNAIAAYVFNHNGKTFQPSASIGVVEFGASRPLTLGDILAAADAACYLAKEKGRNRVQIFSQDDDALLMRHGEMETINKIHGALRENRFVLYTQPIVDISGAGQIEVHAEVLIRMLDENGETISPGLFIPAAERYGVMSLIDRWVVRHAFERIAREEASKGFEITRRYSINVSGASIGDDDFLTFVRDLFAELRVSPSIICFELTETAAIASLARAAYFMNELRSIGCQFSLDDFGAGMSSFGYLKHLPVDYVKIDGSFVKDVAHDPIDRAMVEAITNIAHVMGKAVIAEWVENERIVEILQALGVDYGQGYHLGRPVPMSFRQHTNRRGAVLAVA